MASDVARRYSYLLDRQADAGGQGHSLIQAMHGSGTYIRIRFGGGLPTLPDPVPDVPKRPPSRQAQSAQRPVYAPHAFYPD